jgi:ATP-dependent RNA helicase DDX55/SPB4
VIQFDPPQDPQAFTHRCGRTARNGKTGNAIVFLSPYEDTYIDFLSLRKVPLVEYTNEDVQVKAPITQDLYETLLNLNEECRENYERSMKAFVSWVRSYKEHQAKYIFRFDQVELSKVAYSFGLLHVR